VLHFDVQDELVHVGDYHGFLRVEIGFFVFVGDAHYLVFYVYNYLDRFEILESYENVGFPVKQLLNCVEETFRIKLKKLSEKGVSVDKL